MEFDYKTLLMLRKRTKLGPVPYLKVKKERNAAINYQVTINRLENCHIGVDYSKAEQLEANYRFELWKKELLEYWLQYASGRDLDEFALDILNQIEERETKEKQKVKKISN